MARLIVDYEGPINEALPYVQQVINQGRISAEEKQFCYVTIFKDGTIVYADQTQTGTDTFKIRKREAKE